MATNNTEEKLNIYFGCSDPYGDNRPEDIFYSDVLPVLRKHGLPEDEIYAVANSVREMIERAYSNGMDSEAFDREDGYPD